MTDKEKIEYTQECKDKSREENLKNWIWAIIIVYGFIAFIAGIVSLIK
jgi:hypothetical protein